MTQPKQPEEQIARWELAGPAFQSREDIRLGPGRLGCDYTTNVDGRYSDGIRLGPKINTVELSAVGGTRANTNGFVRCRSLYASAEIALVTSGTDYTFVRLSDMAAGTDPAISLASRALSPLYTKNAAGTEMLSICLAAATYRNITALAGAWPTVTVTESACNEAITNQCIFEGWPSNVIFGGGAQIIRHNEISGTVTMDASAWAERGTVTGEGFTFTAGCALGDFVVFGTTNGLYYFDASFQEYKALIPEISQSATHCMGMKPVTSLGGVLTPIGNGLWLANDTGAKSMGISKYAGNLSPIRGRVTAIAPLDPPEWTLLAVLNPVTTDTHLVYARKPTDTDPFSDMPLIYFPVATLTGIDVECMEDLGTDVRTNPTTAFGHDDDLAYIVRGRTDRDPDDTNYLYGQSGTWYGTTMLRVPPGFRARLKWVEVTADNCDASYYMQAALSLDGGSTYQDIGALLTEDGPHRLEVPEDVDFEGATVKPRLTLTGTSGGTSSPVCQGFLDVGFELVKNEVSRGN